MHCDCDQYARVDLWVGGTLCQRCPMCGTLTVSQEPPDMEPPAFGPDHDGPIRWALWLAAAFATGAGAAWLWALVTGP